MNEGQHAPGHRTTAMVFTVLALPSPLLSLYRLVRGTTQGDYRFMVGLSIGLLVLFALPSALGGMLRSSGHTEDAYRRIFRQCRATAIVAGIVLVLDVVLLLIRR